MEEQSSSANPTPPELHPFFIPAALLIALLLFGVVMLFAFSMYKRTLPKKNSVPATPLVEIKAIPIDNVCLNSGGRPLTVSLERAYLLPSFVDMPKDTVAEIAGIDASADRVAVIEAYAQTEAVADQPELVDVNSVFRLQNGERQIQPFVLAPKTIPPGGSSIFYVYFPLNKSTSQVDLLFCHLNDIPEIIQLDFGSPQTATLRGTFSITNGFTPAR